MIEINYEEQCIVKWTIEWLLDNVLIFDEQADRYINKEEVLSLLIVDQREYEVLQKLRAKL